MAPIMNWEQVVEDRASLLGTNSARPSTSQLPNYSEVNQSDKSQPREKSTSKMSKIKSIMHSNVHERDSHDSDRSDSEDQPSRATSVSSASQKSFSSVAGAALKSFIMGDIYTKHHPAFHQGSYAHPRYG